MKNAKPATRSHRAHSSSHRTENRDREGAKAPTVGLSSWVKVAMASVFLYIGLGATASLAQESGAADDRALEEITVTAQKREQRAIDTAMTVVAIGSEAIERTRLTEFDDLVMMVPGLEVNEYFGRGTLNLSIRGVGTGLNGDPTVLVFTDGFTPGSANVNNTVLFDLERIEVLKGPQATLYGRNAIGGVVNYITKLPTYDFEARFGATIGNNDKWEVNGVLSGPIVDDVLAVRLNVTKSNWGGFLDNEFDGATDVDTRESEGCSRVPPMDPDREF